MDHRLDSSGTIAMWYLKLYCETLNLCAHYNGTPIVLKTYYMKEG